MVDLVLIICLIAWIIYLDWKKEERRKDGIRAIDERYRLRQIQLEKEMEEYRKKYIK